MTPPVSPAFVNADEDLMVSFDALGDWAATSLGQGISAGAILADGCKTGTGAWQKAVRDCLQGPVTYIGTSAMVSWYESTVFCSGFYGAFFRNKGKGVTTAERALDAAERAIGAYERLVDRKCPFKVKTLKPSASAQYAFGAPN